MNTDVVTLWHGTLDVAATKIVHEGLIPQGIHPYDFKRPSYFGGYLPEPYEKEKGKVFFSSDKDHAEWYARFRKWYGGVNPGEHTYSFENNDYQTLTVVKPTNSTFKFPRTSKPVLVKIQIPRSEFEKMPVHLDEEDNSYLSYWMQGKIPARYVKEIIPVPVG